MGCLFSTTDTPDKNRQTSTTTLNSNNNSTNSNDKPITNSTPSVHAQSSQQNPTTTAQLGNHTIGLANPSQTGRRKRVRGVTQKADDADILKIVVCGSGESGKTTFLKNLRINYLGGISDKERTEDTQFIRANIIEGMARLVQYVKSKDNEACLPSEHLDEIDELVDCDPYMEELSKFQSIIKILWNIPDIKDAYTQPDQTEVTDNLDYFFNKLDEIASPNYVPTDDDLLRLRKRTIGVKPLYFELDGAYFEVNDVGGQLNERKHWPEVLKDALAIIWVVSLSEFDRCMFEETTKTRFKDSLECYDSIVNSAYSVDLPVYLLCNKWELFQTKIQNTESFSKYFDDYMDDPHDPNQASEFMIQKFKDTTKHLSETRTFKSYRITAINKDSVSDAAEQIFSDLLKCFE